MTEVREGFVRQRRSLVASSIVLVLFLSSGISLSTVSILGNDFDLTRPSAVPVALWIVWGYFLVRYYQYFRDLADGGPAQQLEEFRHRTVTRRAKRKLETAHFPLYWEGQPPDGTRNISLTSWNAVRESNGHWTVRFSGAVTHVHREGDTSLQVLKDHPVDVEPLSRMDAVRGVLWVVANTRYFTEYALLFVVGLSPLVVAAILALGARS